MGHIVFNRSSMKLAGRRVDNPPEMIRHDNAFEGIVDPRLFARARKRLAEVANNKKETDQQLLDSWRLSCDERVDCQCTSSRRQRACVTPLYTQTDLGRS
ncbi:hypothetical protein ACVWW1_003298 [Bradyrhizobium sp. JR3.5]